MNRIRESNQRAVSYLEVMGREGRQRQRPLVGLLCSWEVRLFQTRPQTALYLLYLFQEPSIQVKITPEAIGTGRVLAREDGDGVSDWEDRAERPKAILQRPSSGKDTV